MFRAGYKILRLLRDTVFFEQCLFSRGLDEVRRQGRGEEFGSDAILLGQARAELQGCGYRKVEQLPGVKVLQEMGRARVIAGCDVEIIRDEVERAALVHSLADGQRIVLEVSRWSMRQESTLI